MWQGGNQWSAYDSYLSFFRHVARLDLPQYAAYDHWETLARRSGPRIVHPEFCMISDRPEWLTVDDRNRPHHESRPFCQWRDGSAIYAWHGIYVPAHVIERPEDITPKMIDDEPNQEIRRVMIERYGYDRYAGRAKTVHQDEAGKLRKRKNKKGDVIAVVEVVNGSKEPDGTYKRYFLSVPPECKTATEAVAWTYGMSESDYSKMVKRT